MFRIACCWPVWKQCRQVGWKDTRRPGRSQTVLHVFCHTLCFTLYSGPRAFDDLHSQSVFFFNCIIEGSYRRHLYFTTVHHRTVWPLEVLKDLKRKGSDSPGPGSYRSRSRTLCRDPSSENLFVDLGAQPRCPQSVARSIPSWQTQKDKANGMTWGLPLKVSFKGMAYRLPPFATQCVLHRSSMFLAYMCFRLKSSRRSSFEFHLLKSEAQVAFWKSECHLPSMVL